MENKETHKEFGGYDQGMKLAIFIDKKSFYSVVMFWGERGHDCGNDPDFSIEVNGTLSVDAKGESGAIKFTPKKVYFGRAAYSTFKEYLNEKKLFGKSDWNNSKISNFDLSKVEFISSVLKESSSQFKISKDESNENLIQFSAGIPFAVVKEFSSKSANNDLIDITFSEVPKIYFKHYRPTDDE